MATSKPIFLTYCFDITAKLSIAPTRYITAFMRSGGFAAESLLGDFAEPGTGTLCDVGGGVDLDHLAPAIVGILAPIVRARNT